MICYHSFTMVMTREDLMTTKDSWVYKNLYISIVAYQHSLNPAKFDHSFRLCCFLCSSFLSRGELITVGKPIFKWLLKRRKIKSHLNVERKHRRWVEGDAVTHSPLNKKCETWNLSVSTRGNLGARTYKWTHTRTHWSIFKVKIWLCNRTNL